MTDPFSRSQVSAERSWTTDVAVWSLVVVNSVHLVVNAIELGRFAFSDGDVFGFGETPSSDVRATTAVIVALTLAALHVWVFVLCRELYRRRAWTRWAITATLAPLVLWSTIAAFSGPGIGVRGWVTLAANIVVLVWVWHPRTSRELWWASKARQRPDLVRSPTDRS